LVENERTYPTSMVLPLGVTQLEFHRDLWHQKLEFVGYCTALFSWFCV